MRWLKMVLAVVLVTPSALLALDDRSQIIADRYLSLLVENPASPSAMDKLWEIYASAGDTEALLTRSQALASKDDRARLAYARLLQRAGQIPQSVEILKPIAGDGFSAAQWTELGRTWQKAGDPSQALSAWQAAVELAPTDLLLRRELASACIDAALYPEALAHLQTIAQNADGTEKLEALEQISSLHERRGELEAALQAQDQILALLAPSHWKYSNSLKRLMALHRRAHSLDNLRATWEADARRRPGDLTAVLRLADLAEFETDFPSATKYLETALKLSPENASLALRLADLLRNQGRLEEAIVYYQQAVRLQPANQEYVFALAETESLRGNDAGALKAWESLRQSLPDTDATRELEVEFYRKLRLYTAWESALRRRLKDAPNDVTTSKDLAALYLQLGREKDAITVLDQFHVADRDPTVQRELYSDFARLFREARRSSGNLYWARKAWAVPGSGAPEALQLADALWAMGDSREAVDFLESFCAKFDLPPEDVDRRLFLALQSQAASNEEGSLVVTRKASQLLEQAAKTDFAPAWLRAARWARWSNQPGQAATALEETIRHDPSSLEAWENLASVRESLGDAAAAKRGLAGLLRLQPERRLELERRIARLEIQSGNADAGTAILRRLADEQPGQWQPLSDLAAAHQAAGNWFEALEILMKASAIAPPQEQGLLRSSILKACDRLRLPDKALRFLESSAMAASPEQRAEILRDAAVFAEEQQMLPVWQERVLAGRAAFPNDSVWIIAAAELAGKTQGQDAMQDALAWMQADKVETPETLQVLVKQAADAQDWTQAASLTRRAALLSSPPSSSLWLEAAGYLDRAGDREALRRHWQTTRFRFPNDPDVLLSAADFFHTQNDLENERLFLQAAVRLSNVPPRAWLRLGKSWLATGDRNQAYDAWQRLLQQTPTDPTQSRFSFPIPPGVYPGTRPDVLVLPSDREAEGSRLLAIAAMGDLLEGSPARDEWIRQFDGRFPLEKIWASYHSGLIRPALEGLALASESPELHTKASAALILISLSNGDFSQLRPWINEASVPSRGWSEIIASLRDLLVSGWRPTSTTLDFFSEAPAYFRWQAAESFAAHGLFRSAITLGKSAVGDFSPPQASSALLALADWQMNCRDEPAMLSSLDDVIALGTGSSTLTTPFYSALRVRWLLSDEPSRKVLEETALRSVSTSSARQTVLLMLAALRHDEDSFSRQALTYLENLQDTEEANRSALLLQSSLKLQEWGLEAESRELCRTGLQRDPAMQVLLGEQYMRNSLEGSIFFSKMQDASPAEASFLAAEWVGSGRRAGECMNVAARLLAIGRTESARAIFEYLFSREPATPALWNHLLALTPLSEFSRPEKPLAEWFLSASQEDREKIPAALVAQLASVIWNRGEPEQALAIISLSAAPDNVGVQGLAHARMLVAMGRQSDALTILESLPPSPESNLLARDLQQGLGRPVTRDLPPAVSSAASPKIDPPPPTSLQSAMSLVEEERWPEAADRLAKLDQEGLPGAVQTLAYARVLWLSGRRADAIDIANFVRRFLVIDPARSVELAAFYLGVNRPYAAAKLLEEYETPPFLSRRKADLWQQAAVQFLARGAVEDARTAAAHSSAHPAALNPDFLVDLLAAEGSLQSVDPATVPFGLQGQFLATFRLAMARRLADMGLGTESLAWLETDPGFMNSADARKILSQVENSDPTRAAALWDIAASSPLVETRQDASAYLSRRADASDTDRLALLRRAHKIYPASVEVSRILARELPSGEGVMVIDQTLQASLSPQDRAEMQQWKESLKQPAPAKSF